MPDRIAVKRLTASDLTFFEPLFRSLNAGNQKAINLNADVFIDRFYPGLPFMAASLGDVIPVSLTILGPAGAHAYALSRAVTKRDAYKNWRLNGEFVRDPEGEPGRFEILRAGDLAVMDFAGDPGPQRLTLLLISAAATTDLPLYAALNPIVPGGRRTMAQVTRAQVATAAATLPPTHPIWAIATDPELDSALEDAALGGTRGLEALQRKAATKVSAATLAAAKAAAEKNGREGEALAWVHLQMMRGQGVWERVEWASQKNAVSPFDFVAFDGAVGAVRIDAKSTGGEFERIVHMSLAELCAAADGSRYDLWRIYALNDNGACLKISQDIGEFAASILKGIELPTGVSIDSVSIDPGALRWGPEIVIERPDEDLGSE